MYEDLKPDNMSKSKRPNKSELFLSVVLVSFVTGLLGAIIGLTFYFQVIQPEKKKDIIEKESIAGYLPQTAQEKLIINAIEKVSPAVVSIVISKDVPVFEQYYYNPFEQFEDVFGPGYFEYQVPQYRQKGTEKQDVGNGTGVIVSEDGIILTNKHVVAEEDAEYTVFTSEGKKFEAKVLARDPVQDLAVMKIEQDSESFPVATLGSSEDLKMGQSVIAIGNALGEFKNTVSVGVISGLGRTITASSGSTTETLENVIQTDAAINRGNSGGPLLNLKGEIIGINAAMVTDAQSIGFAIPIERAKKDIEQVQETGEISYPFLGVRYILVSEQVQEEYELPVDYGALIIKGESGEPGVTPDSGAGQAGLQEGDIILEFDGQRITQNNSLSKIISMYSPGDKVNVKYLREGGEITVEIELGQRE